MFGTVLHDVFLDGDRNALATAVDDLCAPDDTYGWASVGIYAFYDPDAVRPGGMDSLLYLGLARDLSERLRQHLGLQPCQESGCKRTQVNSWFSTHSRLGFACFVQSPLAQVNTHRERNSLQIQFDEEAPGGLIDNPPEGLESAVLLEGQAIESYRLLVGALPPWNKIGGSVVGALRAPKGSATTLLRLMVGGNSSLFRARRTIRELSEDSLAAEFESNVLHVARMDALMHYPDGASTPELLATLERLASDRHYRANGFGEAVEDMRAAGYLAELAD